MTSFSTGSQEQKWAGASEVPLATLGADSKSRSRGKGLTLKQIAAMRDLANAATALLQQPL